MLRAASAAQVLRRTLSCTSPPLLRDAAVQGAASGWVEASSVERLGVFSALRAAPRRLSAAATAPAAVVCACVLERLPIVMPPRPAWETEYQVRDQLRHPRGTPRGTRAACLHRVLHGAGVAVREAARDVQGVSKGAHSALWSSTQVAKRSPQPNNRLLRCRSSLSRRLLRTTKTRLRGSLPRLRRPLLSSGKHLSLVLFGRDEALTRGM